VSRNSSTIFTAIALAAVAVQFLRFRNFELT
jgi:hypothetical protein